MNNEATQPNTPVNLFGMDQTHLKAFFVARGQPGFRATQLTKWIYQRGILDFSQMTDMSQGLREELQQSCVVEMPSIFSEKLSSDGTRKWLMSLQGGGLVETVFIPEKTRGTLCISSQVGCALNCSFCATARQGFQRNLTSAEIIGQLWLATQRLQAVEHPLCREVTNIVMMGMGEPLLNFDAVSEALTIMRDDQAYGLPRRRVTVSTSGVVPGIQKLAEQNDVSLAISLHASNDAVRDILVPINKKYPIKTLLETCKDYTAANKRYFVTMEYVMLAGVNDSPAQARELVKILKDVPCKVNLIPFNPFKGAPYKRSSDLAIKKFAETLSRANIVVTTRTTRGDDIDAACGQLVGQVADRTRRSERYQQKLTTDNVMDNRQ